jgi:transposase
MKKSLTTQERTALVIQHKSERDGRVRDRIKAVLLRDKGYSYTKIAEILLLDDETVRRHVKDYFIKNKLAPTNGGSVCRMSLQQSELLKSHLREKTYLYVKEICAYVRSEFILKYTQSGMTKWLKANGFCYKKPHGIPAKADESKQEEFIKYYETLKKNLPKDDVIYFLDACHPQHQTKLAYGWIEKGVRKSEKMTACQKRVNLIAGINVSNHDVEYAQAPWINGESIEAFLKQLIAAQPKAKTIHIIWDNAGYHKSQAIRDFVSTTNIKLHFLPAYSPNLNPIERLWKVMHENITYNRYYPKFSDFTEGILSFFEKITDYKSILVSRITDNFQRLNFAS